MFVDRVNFGFGFMSSGVIMLPNSLRVLVVIISMYSFWCSLMFSSHGVMGSWIVSHKYFVLVLMEPTRSLPGC